MLWMSGSSVGRIPRSEPMTRSFDRVCRCCGTPFIAFNPTAKWCSSRCSMRAFQRRRRGAPEADHGVSFQPAVLQAQILDDPDDLPLAWRDQAPAASAVPFAFGSYQVRVITDAQGVPWFVAADVCNALDLGNSRMAMERLDDDEKSTELIPTPGGTQSLTTVNEPGLYSLIFGSRKPEARAFKRWVTHEVLPTIRKTGSYSTTATPSLPPGVHVIASSPRQANWLWKQAVEAEVSSALMRALAQENRQPVNPSHFQLHLLSA
jgi:prophage antirepressor-like protein